MAEQIITSHTGAAGAPDPAVAQPKKRRWWLGLLAAVLVLGAGSWTVQKIVRANSSSTPTPALLQSAPAAVQQADATTAAPREQVAPAADNEPVHATVTTRQDVLTIEAPLSTINQQALPMAVIVGAEGALLLDRPAGADGQPLAAGELFNAVGRTADNQWLAVQRIDGVSGWVATSEVVAFGVSKLAVLDPTTFTVKLPAAQAIPASAPVADTSVVTTSATVTATTLATATEVIAAMPNTVTTPTAATTADTGAAPATASDETATVTLSSGRLNVRSGPGTTYGIVAKAYPGDQVTVVGRNAAADWVQIQLPEGDDAIGWVAARYLDLTDVASLPLSTTTSNGPAIAAATPPTAAVTAAVTTPTGAASSATVQAVAATSASTTQASSPATSAATGLRGTLVFQSSPGGMIYAYDLAGGRLWQLTNGFDPAISPDGAQVAFVRAGGENGVYLINIDGSNERLIFSGRETLSSPKWSPDGQWLLFSRRDEYTECVDVGRGNCVSPGTLPPGMSTDEVTLSKEYEFNLARVDTNGDNYRDIAALESARAADWNEAGIVYQSSAGLQITADSADATNRLLLFTQLQPPYEDPDWQPNGGQVAFVQHHGSHYEIFTINADGSGMTALTRPVTTLVDQLPNNVAPAWSPDGEHIVFLSNRQADNEAGAWRLWVMDKDGSNQRPLSIDVTINYTYGNEQAVSWGL